MIYFYSPEPKLPKPEKYEEILTVNFFKKYKNLNEKEKNDLKYGIINKFKSDLEKKFSEIIGNQISEKSLEEKISEFVNSFSNIFEKKIDKIFYIYDLLLKYDFDIDSIDSHKNHIQNIIEDLTDVIDTPDLENLIDIILDKMLFGKNEYLKETAKNLFLIEFLNRRINMLEKISNSTYLKCDDCLKIVETYFKKYSP